MDPFGSLPQDSAFPSQQAATKRSLSGRQISRPNLRPDPQDSPSSFDANATAARATMMQTIPPDVFEHIDSLKNYEDGMILHWLALVRGTGAYRCRPLRKPTVKLTGPY
jgi:hypothetical protein